MKKEEKKEKRSFVDWETLLEGSIEPAILPIEPERRRVNLLHYELFNAFTAARLLPGGIDAETIFSYEETAVRFSFAAGTISVLGELSHLAGENHWFAEFEFYSDQELTDENMDGFRSRLAAGLELHKDEVQFWTGPLRELQSNWYLLQVRLPAGGPILKLHELQDAFQILEPAVRALCSGMTVHPEAARRIREIWEDQMEWLPPEEHCMTELTEDNAVFEEAYGICRKAFEGIYLYLKPCPRGYSCRELTWIPYLHITCDADGGIRFHNLYGRRIGEIRFRTEEIYTVTLSEDAEEFRPVIELFPVIRRRVDEVGEQGMLDIREVASEILAWNRQYAAHQEAVAEQMRRLEVSTWDFSEDGLPF